MSNKYKKGVINSGEPVLFIPVSFISYVDPDSLAKSVKITLSIKEKNSNNILAETKLIIEDYGGNYKVKK